MGAARVSDLAKLSGLGGAMAEVQAAFPAALARSAAAAFEGLCAAGLVRDGAEVPRLEMPRALAQMLAAAVALEEREASGRAAVLRTHYLETMPRLRTEQLATREHPTASFFHAPLAWERLPRLSGAIDALYALVRDTGAAEAVLGAPTATTFRARYRTLAELYAETYYGAQMPLLYGYPADLAYFARDLDGGVDVERVIDRHLAAPMIHEMMHFRRDREAVFPLYVDECVAGYLGVRVLPGFAFPGVGEANAIYAAPWFAQVGQALVRAVGIGPVLRAHAGAMSWEEALPSGLARKLAQLGWADHVARRSVHFLSDNWRPEPWMKLFFLAAAGVSVDAHTLASLEALPWTEVPPGEEDPFDEQIVADALRAMCLRNYRVGAHFVAEGRVPGAEVVVDLDACSVTTAAGEDGCDLRAPQYLFPPAVAARLRREGGARRFAVGIRSVEEIAERAWEIVRGAR
jgi:hypothetical protein